MNSLDIPNLWPEAINLLLFNDLNYLQKSHLQRDSRLNFVLLWILISVQTFIEHLFSESHCAWS